MTSKWNKIKEEYWYPAWPLCWLCREANADQLHHWMPKGLFKDRKMHKYLDQKEDAFPICTECHKTAHTWEFRSKAYAIKCFELGKKRMDAWLNTLGMKVGEKYGEQSNTDSYET